MATILEKRIAYIFKNKDLLKYALTHKSCAPGIKPSAFERLEFLGDRVLALWMSAYLFEKYPLAEERDLALRLARLVDRNALVNVAQTIDLHQHIRFDKTLKKRTQLSDSAQTTAFHRSFQKIVGDAMEALIAALFLDAGFQKTGLLLQKLWQPLLTQEDSPPKLHSKSRLQEVIQKSSGTLPVYTLAKQEGLAHDPLLTIDLCVTYEGKKHALRTQGTSRRKAEEKAATLMLQQLKQNGA